MIATRLASARWWAVAGLVGVGLLAQFGCAPAGRIELVALNFTSIDPPAPTTGSLDLDHCYWWEDEDGQLWFAAESGMRPFFGQLGDFRFHLSLALERLPAGKARDYDIRRRELRAVARFGPTESRFTSSRGIMAVYRESHDRLRGSFRIHVRREMTRLLGGWGNPTSYVMQGTFTARHDSARGRPIAKDTESQGWEREPLPQERTRDDAGNSRE